MQMVGVLRNYEFVAESMAKHHPDATHNYIDLNLMHFFYIKDKLFVLGSLYLLPFFYSLILMLSL